MTKELCRQCGKTITKDEKGLNKKLISKKVKEYMCISCLADYLQTSEEALNEKIEEFKEEGCTLFL